MYICISHVYICLCYMYIPCIYMYICYMYICISQMLIYFIISQHKITFINITANLSRNISNIGILSSSLRQKYAFTLKAQVLPLSRSVVYCFIWSTKFTSSIFGYRSNTQFWITIACLSVTFFEKHCPTIVPFANETTAECFCLWSPPPLSSQGEGSLHTSCFVTLNINR